MNPPTASHALLEVLLDKDSGHRFQKSAELLKAIPTITGAINARRRNTVSVPATPSSGEAHFLIKWANEITKRSLASPKTT
jgi:hypothetical protein